MGVGDVRGCRRYCTVLEARARGLDNAGRDRLWCGLRPLPSARACAAGGGHRSAMTPDVAPNLPPVDRAEDARARRRRSSRPYRRQVIYAAIALVVAAAAVLAVGQGLKGVVDRGFSAGDAGQLDRTLAPDARRRRRDGRGDVHAFLLRVVDRRARHGRPAARGVRPSADAAARILRGDADRRRDLPPDQRHRDARDRHRLQRVDGDPQPAASRRRARCSRSRAPSSRLLVLAGVPVVSSRSCCSGAGCASSRGRARTASATSARTSTRRCTRVRTVQAYGHEPVDRRRFGERVEAAFGTAVDRIRQRALLVAAVIMLVFGAVGVILWIGGHDVVAGRISAGQLSAFVFYAVIVAAAVGTISEVVGDLQRAAGATERLFELLAVEPAIRAPAHPVALPTPARGTVSFDHVVFHYPSRPDTPALDDFSLVVVAGEKVALVGPSGAGKTTVFQLLLRFYDPQAGSVRIDGVDVRHADPREVRRRLAVVPQDPVIFAASVVENVRYGRPDATEAEVRAACEAAYASEFVATLPQGTRATSASAACGSPADSGSASRSRARSSPIARSCCSTKRRARSTPRASASCSSRSSG